MKNINPQPHEALVIYGKHSANIYVCHNYKGMFNQTFDLVQVEVILREF